jgi:hypothetical protein
MIVTRDATPADNAALLALASGCPMVGDLTMCVERDPDFFALNRLEGERWRVGVATAPGHEVSGCVGVSERQAYLFGRPAETVYAGDLKVHPGARGGGSAPALFRWAQDAGRAYGGADAPTLVTILAGNRPMERLVQRGNGLPVMDRFATVRVYAIPLLTRRRPADAGLRITRAEWRDVGAMLELWRRVAPRRQFAPVFDAERFVAWVAAAPGLAIHDYWLAWRADGRLAGFVALWEQSAFKRLRLLAYSRRLAALRLAINSVGRLTGGATLPRTGEPLRTATALHLCVPAEEPAILRALLLRSYAELRAQRFAFFTLGLDVRDPLTAALRGLLAQPTDVNAWITTPAGRYTAAALDDRPLHYDIAFV